MKLEKIGVLAAVLTLVGGMPAQAAQPSAWDLARAPAIHDVSISRDGKHIVALTSPDGKAVNISVWDTQHLDRPPIVLGSKHMRFLDVGFLKNDRLLVLANQTYTLGSQKTHAYKEFVTDLHGEEWNTVLPDRAGKSDFEDLWNAHFNSDIISTLPLDKTHVIAVDRRLDGYGDVYKVDVYNGRAERIDRGSEKFLVQADLKGEIRAKTEINYDNGKVYMATWLKHPDTGKFEEHFRWYVKDRVPNDVVGFDTDRNVVFLRTTPPGKDKAGIYVYDVRGRKIVEPVFEHKLFDAMRLRFSTNPDNFGLINGIDYEGESVDTYWVNPNIAALAKLLRASFQYDAAKVDWVDPGTGERARINVPKLGDAKIINWSEDDRFAIVRKSGPGQPEEYYLLSSTGKLSLLGKSRPWIDPAMIGETQLVQFPARDGLMVPGFLSLPPKATFGEGPYPTIIMPHGGPWARDYLEWDVSGWPQYLASRGYAVLKPQYRGSEGWGQKLWRAGDGEWGQKMQDDKDDGAKWLIDQKIAAPDRIAIFGYSYGGYAALAAAIRPNGIYQCAISGAGAPDLGEFRKRTFENRFAREFQNPTIKGLDALEHAAQASIPVFLYHGDRDSTVDVEQSREFAAKLKAAGKPYKYLELKDMGHQFVTMEPSHLETQLVEIEMYLKTDCGPGGL